MTTASPAALHRNPIFRKTWLIGFFCGVVRWLELLAFGVYAVEVTGSPAMVSLMVILRFLPLALFGAIMGAIADIVSVRTLLAISFVANLTVATGMWLFFVYGEPSYWHVAAAAFASGVLWAGDFPFRRKLLGESVSEDRLPSAMAIDGATSNGTRMLGPLFGGLIYVELGMAGVFALGMFCYTATLLVTLTLPHAPPRARVGAAVDRLLAPLRGVVEAVRYSVNEPDVARILLVSIAFNIWGFPYLSMVPVIGAGELGLSPDTIGVITAGEGLFALIGAYVTAKVARPENYRLLYLGATLALALTVLAIGLFTGFWVLTFGLAVGGFCTAIFGAMQGTLIYVVAPPAMRGRFLGLMTICIGIGVVGFANIGLTAEIFGASNALWIIGLEGLIPIIAIGWGWRRLWPERALPPG